METDQGNNLNEKTSSCGLSEKSWAISDVTKCISDQLTKLSRTNSENCQICSQKFQVVNNQMKITKCEFVEETLDKVLQSLLVPAKQRKANKNGPSGVLLSVCLECIMELKTLKDNILHIDNLRIQFERFRRKIGRKIVMSSTGNSEGAFKCWQNRLNNVEHIYPSCLDCKLTATDDGSSNETIEEINTDSSLSQRQLQKVILSVDDEPSEVF